MIDEKQFNYFKYHTPETKPRKIVLLGLPQMNISDIQEYLNNNDVFPKDIKTDASKQTPD